MFDVPGESVLPLSGHRSDVRGIAKSVVIGEQLDAGTGAASTAPAPPARPLRGSVESKPKQFFLSTTAPTSPVSCRGRDACRCIDGTTADPTAVARAAYRPSAHPRAAQQSREAAAATGNTHSQGKNENHQLEQDT